VQCKQHQSHADRHSAEVLYSAARTAPERDEADDEKHRSRRRDIKRKDLNDQGRADVRPQHDC
jgi:hypothetical protein